MQSIKSGAIMLLPLLVGATIFTPESDGYLAYRVASLPVGYNLTQGIAKSSNATAPSAWISAFIHGSDGHDYAILSHVITALPNNPSYTGVYRGSILDITNTSRYAQFTNFSSPLQSYNNNGDFNASFSNFGFGYAGTRNGNPLMRSWSATPGIEYDLAFELSSPVLMNGGLGGFGIDGASVREWSMPAGKTTGWLALDGKKVTVDSKRSLTWYDQQWNGAPKNWTWFELHVDNESPAQGSTPMSIWTYDTPNGLGGMATIRDSPGVQKVVPVASLKPSDRTYTSPSSNVTYPLDWSLELVDGTKFEIFSVRSEQELVGANGQFPTYEGYVMVKCAYKGRRVIGGYGLVEVFP